VARRSSSEDPKENMGAQLVREVASKDLGLSRGRHDDGHRSRPSDILREGVKAVTAGANPMDLKKGIEKAVEKAVEEIRSSPAKSVERRFARLARSRRITTRRSARFIARRWRRSARTASSPSRKPRVSKLAGNRRGMQFDAAT